MVKKLISVLLTLCITVSMFSVSFVDVSAGAFTIAIKNFGMNKLIDLGYRTIAKATSKSLNAMGDATGMEGINKVSSIINTVLMGSTGKKLGEIKSLCEDILNEIEDMHEDMDESFAVVEKMLGQKAAEDARNKQDEKWQNDVKNVIDKHNAGLALEQYQEYMQACIDYSNDKSNTAAKEKYEDEKELLIKDFSFMYSGDITIDVAGDLEQLKDALFTSTSIDKEFISLINELSANLVKGENSSRITLAETAAKTAYEYFPFSHQQYDFVHTVIGEQLMELSMCMLMASEFFDMQGEYILEHYGEGSPQHSGYVNEVNQYYDIVSGKSYSIENRVNEMLEAEMVVDSSITLTLNDYMKPEDAVSTMLNIQDYSDHYDFYDVYGTRYYTTSDAVYIQNNVKFNRIATAAADGTKVYYILDSTQFSDEKASLLYAIDSRWDISGAADTHYTSCDYQNLINKMSDGVNTFQSTSNMDALSALFNTNAFSVSGRVPATYLDGYIPKNAETYIITTGFDNYAEHGWLWKTAYAHYKVIDATALQTSATPVTKEISGQIAQLDQGGENRSYSAILVNENDTYKQTAHLSSLSDGVSDAEIVSADSNITITENDTSAVIPSGEVLSIKFKLKDGATFKSLKCVRNSDVFSNNESTTETVLLDSDDFNMISVDDNGYYTVEYPMPYSDATFVIEAHKHEFDSNGFCVNDGAYQPATLNSNGVYEISNAGQLYWFASLVNGDRTYADFDSQNAAANAVLVKDIVVNSGDVSKLADTNPSSLRKWIPIGTLDCSYTGQFDGQRHTISGLYFNDSNANYVGLFGFTRGGADIYNVGVINSYFKGKNSVGAIIGYNNNSGVTIQRCFSEATVVGNEGVGGIEGETYGGKIVDCYNAGSVTGSTYVGSIRGKNTYGTTSSGALNNCFNVGKVTGTGNSNIGGIRGDGSGTISNCYCISTQLTDTAATTKSSEQFASGEVAYLLNNSVTNGKQIWYQNIDNGETRDSYPKFKGGTVYYNENKHIYSNYPPVAHKYDDNGFCVDCGQYQPAVLNSNGVYEISNAGQLFWFAALVNGDSTHADFDKRNTGANAVLVNDIDLEGREWTPIMNYSGEFGGDENCQKISGLSITKSGERVGLFGTVSGRIHDFKVDGNITVSSNSYFVGGVAGESDGAEIVNVVSDVDIHCDSVWCVGGIVGLMENSSRFYNCMYKGNMEIVYSVFGTGGIVGCADLYNSSNDLISNCANIGDISGYTSDMIVGGIAGLLCDKTDVVNCYNYGNVSVCNGDNSTCCGAIIGLADSEFEPTIENNYYLKGSAANTFGEDCMSSFENSSGISKTADEFASGEVAYLLNSNRVHTDISYNWYQNIDNGKTPDDYPVFDVTHGTVYKTVNCAGKTVYSNYQSDGKPAHQFNENGFCKVCGAYQPATLNNDGVYEIGNAGQLFWFAALVNGDSTHAEFDKQNAGANAVLVNDIELESREWTPIGNNANAYSGVFDGENYSIKNINGMLFGSVNGGTLKNICIASGFFKGNSDYAAHTGSIVGTMYNGTITHSCSKAVSGYVVGDLGGLAGKACGTITDCYFAGTLNGSGTTGGIAGSSWNTNEPLNMKNCYVSANSINGDSNTGAFVGWLHENSTVDNSFYNRTAYSGNPFGTSQNENYTNEAVKALSAKSYDEFKSGEVTYLLNSEVTDGTQVWYQNIDNDKTPDDYPKFDGGTVYSIQNCAGKPVAYSNYQSDSKLDHQFDENGFCKVCGEYQPAVLNSDGVYEISNAGQLFWFASLVNGDRTHAEFDKQNVNANAVLIKDIDLESREWAPIGNAENPFIGTFDGQNHTISNLKITKTSTCSGLFGNTGGTIKNFTVKGDITLSSDGLHIGGAVGCADGAVISNVASYVNISNTEGALTHVGGLIGTIGNNETIVEKCVYYGTINISNSIDCIGGVVAYSNSGGRISNCANYGTVTTSAQGAYTGGILGYVNNSNPTVKNCYNYGTVSNGDITNHCGAIIGWARNYSLNNITNNYYLDSSSSLAFGSDSKSGATAVSKTADEFKSGEVTYLLNNGVTDGSQVWYQNIDNDKTPDDYPKFNGGTVYYLDYKDTYSNTYSEAPKEPDAFDKDDDGNLIIKTYDDLVKLSQLIRSDYDIYGSQNYILINNIKAPDDSEWTQGIGSAADSKPFNGTFYGNGYCIIGLNVNSSEYGGLFEIIGEKGCVKDLLVFDCKFTSSPTTSGGIAAVNNGTIDHCISGINPATGTIHFGNTTINVSDLNSNIKGEISGGIVGENNGLITGCRNASVAAGTQCGGIAGLNTGKIYCCANNSAVGTSASKVSGGLAGKNGGIIESSYNSAVINGSSEGAKGSIAGINGYEGSGNPKVTNVFYRTANGLDAVGTDSSVIPDSTNIGMSSISDFQNDSFTDKLNSVSDDTVTWVRHSVLNKSYPTIEGNFLKINVKTAGNNIFVKGSMHSSLNISYTVCDKNDSLYKLLSASTGENKILKSYSLSLTDNDGNYIPAELWCQGSFEISVPVDSENVKFAGIDEEGNIVYCKPDSVENGIAVFTVSHPMSFAIVETAKNVPNGGDTGITTPTTNSDDSTPVQTGSATGNSVLLIAMFSMVLIIALRRRNNIE